MNHPNRRILIVDDNEGIHHDFQRVLAPAKPGSQELAEAESLLFGIPTTKPPVDEDQYDLEFAYQGEDALALVRQRLREHRQFDCAFVDVRMPPGIDGVQTTMQMWRIDRGLPVVLCTAYSDYLWQDIIAHLGKTDGLFILKKPFEAIEVRQLAMALTERRRKEGARAG